MSLEDEDELEMLQKDVDHVCEAMLAFPLRLPFTRFHKGLKVFELQCQFNSLTQFLYT